MEVDEAEEAPEAAEPAAKKQKLQPTLLSFVSKHAPPAARIATERKVNLSTYKPKEEASAPVRNTAGRGPSKKKNGGRKNDVTAKTLHKRVSEHPGHKLRPSCGQLYCGTCGHNIASGKGPCADHCNSDVHKKKLEEAGERQQNSGANTMPRSKSTRGSSRRSTARTQKSMGSPRTLQRLKSRAPNASRRS
eukprot:1058131-Prymnesium_polylepis.1